MAAESVKNTLLISPLDNNDIAMLKLDQTETSTVMSESDYVKTVGLVEDIFIGEDFESRHHEYFTKHCAKFSKEPDCLVASTELENLSKERFNIFRMYSVEMASFLEGELRRSLGKQFEIEHFIQEVERRTTISESSIVQEKGSSGGGGNICPKSPRTDSEAGAVASDIKEIMNGEIFEMLLTLKDYARFQELMVDYLEMIQGTTPDMEGLVSLRHLSDDEEEDNN